MTEENANRRLWSSVVLRTIQELKHSRQVLEQFHRRLPAYDLRTIRAEVDNISRANHKERKIFHAYRLWLECSSWLLDPKQGGAICELLGHDYQTLKQKLALDLKPPSIPLNLLHITFRRELRRHYVKQTKERNENLAENPPHN